MPNRCINIWLQGLIARNKPAYRAEAYCVSFAASAIVCFCRSCKADNPMVDVDQVGTEAVVTSTCSNPKCPYPKTTWHSQPPMPGTKLPAGNFLLCMAILLAGASASKVFTVFAHMGLGSISLYTFFKYQRVSTCSHKNNVQHN